MRDFALPIRRIGSLGRSTGSALPLEVGVDIHERLQMRLSSEDSSYRSEIPLSLALTGKSYEFKIRGRCDGEFGGDKPMIEEIKSSFGLPALKKALANEPDHPYILQLKMYGFIYSKKKGVTPKLQLRLVDSRTLEEDVWSVDYDEIGFQLWVQDRLAQIEENLLRYRALIKTRKSLAKQLFFPFSTPRKNQSELVDAVKNSLSRGRKLLLQAPTGLGKTAGVLYPSLLEALSKGSPVVYIAPKNSQFKAAIDLARMFQKKRVKLKVLVLTSKTKACQQDEVLCQNSSCPLAVNYYDKVEASGAKLRDAKKHLWDYAYFQKLSDAFEICPYEIGMERIPEADLIICDYNYVFSPRANFFDRYLDPIVPMTKPYLVIDEAHNLYERVIENYSVQIKLSDLKAFLEHCKASDDQRFSRIVNRAIGLMAAINPRPTHARIELKREAIQVLLDESMALLLSRWDTGGLPLIDDPVFQFYSQWSDLHEITEISQEAIPLIYKREEGDEILKAQCIDPHSILQPLYAQFAGVVAFSATLKPFSFYRHMSGFEEEATDAIEFTSPFPRTNKKIMIIPQVETNYRERSRHYDRIAAIISRVASLEKGPYLVFFSSYGFLREVEKLLGEDFPLITQTSALSDSAVRNFHRLIQNAQETTLILAVQGGSLSEGIDFKGAGIKGVFIVGPAVPSASFERKMMQEHFDKREGDGRAFAYVYPAMTRSVQAAGRIVRDEIERGVIVLMDPRFLQDSFQATMPEDWFETSARELIPQHILSETRAFWDVEKRPSIESDEGPLDL
ncbi:MAG: ATP-dependent DNA helicase [Proteobacteria bacterium]|nr:MAG: ATP-dependent DNA helicase [Pseudomonadota bacterium]